MDDVNWSSCTYSTTYKYTHSKRHKVTMTSIREVYMEQYYLRLV